MFKLDIPKIRYIYHLADIHIRLNERIEEYREVFTELYKSIEQNSIDDRHESIIVMAGDIFDSKTNLKTESLELFDRLMDLLKLMPIIIIAGNHDGNMTNDKYKDALTFVSKIYNRLQEAEPTKLNKLYYLNTTGLYESENMIIGVKHIFDLTNSVPDVRHIKTDKRKICIHHGTISGSRTDIGQVLESEETVNMFSGYDFVLLGDIHKRQFLGKSNTIAYPGSLIQQNYGEKLSGHGYLIWDIQEYEYYEIDIKNNYGYVTLILEKNKIKEPKDILERDDLPKNLNIRIRYENCTAEYLSKLRKSLEDKFTILKYVEENKINRINRMENYMNRKNNNRFEKLIKRYMKENKIDEKYYEIIMGELSDIMKDNKNESIVYSIKKLSISNILCYSNENEIDFTKYGDTVGIFSKNYTGKSTIIDCICECLFDNNLKGISKKDILRYGAKKGYIKLLLDVNGKEYLIEKIYGAKPKVNLYVNNELMNDDTSVKTMKVLKEQLGSLERFRQTDCISQNDNNGIADMTKEQRKKFLKEILDLKDYVDKSKKIREKMASLKVEINMIEQDIMKKEKLLKDLQEGNIEQINNEIEKVIKLKEEANSKIIYEDFKDVINKSKKDIEKQINDNNVLLKALYDEKNKLESFIAQTIISSNPGDLQKARLEKEVKLGILRGKKHKIREYDSVLIERYEKLRKEYEEKTIIADRLRKEILSNMDIIDDNSTLLNPDIEKKHRDFLDWQNKKKYELLNSLKPFKEIISIDINIKEDYINVSNEIEKYNKCKEELDVINNKIHEMKLLKDKYANYEIYLKRKEDIERIEYNENCKVCLKNNKETIDMKIMIDKNLKETWLDSFSNIDKIRRDYKEKMYKREMLEKEMKKYSIEDLMKQQVKLKQSIEQIKLNEENVLYNQEIDKHNIECQNEYNRIGAMIDEPYEKYHKEIDEKLVIINKCRERNRLLNIEVEQLSIKQIYDEIDSMKTIVEEMIAHKKLSEENEQYELEIKLLEKEIEDIIYLEKIHQQISANQNKLKQIIDDINLYEGGNKGIMEKYEKYENNMRYREEVKRQEDKYMVLLKERMIKEQDNLTREKLKDEIINGNEKLMEKYAEKDKYDVLDRIFDKNGLSEYMMKSAYEDISESINYLTEKVCGYQFKIDENTNFLINREGKQYYVENGSGAEKLILNIAFRMTISNIKCISRSDMMIIDESFISFDKDNRNKIEDIIEMILTKYRRVLVISHMEELQEIIRERINIRSERCISYIG
jgi:exonuclease SbcC